MMAWRDLDDNDVRLARKAGAVAIEEPEEVYVVVEKVVLAAPLVSSKPFKKTIAAPGAGTWRVQLAVEHARVVTFSAPTGRPSDEKVSPKVCPPQVKLATSETLEDNRYLE